MTKELKSVRDALELLSNYHNHVNMSIGGICEIANEALSTLDSIMAVPDEYVIVPLKPTGTMLMYGVHVQERDEFRNDGYGVNAEKIYKAMLSAAPKHGGGLDNQTPRYGNYNGEPK